MILLITTTKYKPQFVTVFVYKYRPKVFLYLVPYKQRQNLAFLLCHVGQALDMDGYDKRVNEAECILENKTTKFSLSNELCAPSLTSKAFIFDFDL